MSLLLLLTESHLSRASHEAGAAAWQLLAKRSMLTSVPYVFEPIAVESKTLGVFNESARHLLDDLERMISLNSSEARETRYQRISVLVQRFNAVLLHDSLPAADSTD